MAAGVNCYVAKGYNKVCSCCEKFKSCALGQGWMPDSFHCWFLRRGYPREYTLDRGNLSRSSIALNRGSSRNGLRLGFQSTHGIQLKRASYAFSSQRNASSLSPRAAYVSARPHASTGRGSILRSLAILRASSLLPA